MGTHWNCLREGIPLSTAYMFLWRNIKNSKIGTPYPSDLELWFIYFINISTYSPSILSLYHLFDYFLCLFYIGTNNVTFFGKTKTWAFRPNLICTVRYNPYQTNLFALYHIIMNSKFHLSNGLSSKCLCFWFVGQVHWFQFLFGYGILFFFFFKSFIHTKYICRMTVFSTSFRK